MLSGARGCLWLTGSGPRYGWCLWPTSTGASPPPGRSTWWSPAGTSYTIAASSHEVTNITGWHAIVIHFFLSQAWIRFSRISTWEYRGEGPTGPTPAWRPTPPRTSQKSFTSSSSIGLRSSWHSASMGRKYTGRHLRQELKNIVGFSRTILFRLTAPGPPGGLFDYAGLPGENIWATGGPMAPFDTDFHFIISAQSGENCLLSAF